MEPEIMKCPEGYHLHKWREVRLILRPADIREGPAQRNPYSIYRW